MHQSIVLSRAPLRWWEKNVQIFPVKSGKFAHRMELQRVKFVDFHVVAANGNVNVAGALCILQFGQNL